MTPATAPSGDLAVLRRPHLRPRDGGLYFLASRRPALTLSPAERAVWDELEGEPTLDALRARHGTAVDHVVQGLVAREACVLVGTRWPDRRRRVLVFEPHSDDAALSAGATMWQRREKCEFTIVTLGGRSNYTSYWVLGREFFDPEEISAIREAEGRLFARMIGGRYVALRRNEAPLRYRDGRWTLAWFERHKVANSAFANHGATDAELADWKAAARRVIEEQAPDEVWFNLGVGSHTDHELTRNALLDLLVEVPALAAGRTVRMYQDAPYDSSFPHHVDAVLDALRAHGAVIEREAVRVDDTFARKLELVSVYASQFKVEALRAELERSATLAAGDGGKAEPLHTLRVPPAARDPLELFLDAGLVRAAAPRLAAWARRSADARRVRVLLLMPAGRYRDDLARLLAVFPRASFDVYVSPAAAPEVAEHPSPRATVHEVGRGGAAWALLALRLAAQAPALTVFAAGDRMAVARRLALLWPMSAAVVVPSLDHFMRGLEAALSAPGAAPAPAGVGLPR